MKKYQRYIWLTTQDKGNILIPPKTQFKVVEEETEELNRRATEYIKFLKRYTEGFLLKSSTVDFELEEGEK